METQANLSQPRMNIGFFFLSLGLLITLITSVVSFLNLVFETLNKRFPDVLNSSYQYGYSTWSYEGIRMALATLIIFFPVFVAVSYFWRKMQEGSIGSIDSLIRKWLLSIVLFLASVVIVVDLVTLVRYFISGEVTSRFIIKVLVTLVTALLVGSYYYLLLRRGDNQDKPAMLYGVVGLILVIASVWYSFAIMGSPATQRALRLDDRRVADLQNIQYQVINFWQQKEKLPANLEEMVNPLTGWSMPVPPGFEKGEVYEYKFLGALKFELCATFAKSMPKGWQEYGGGGGGVPIPYFTGGKDIAMSYPYGGGMNESWDHEAGRTCFERTIDKDIYPPYPKQ